MEGDHAKKNQKEANSLKRNILDACNVLPTLWLRCIVQVDYGAKWIILDSRRYLLWNFRIFFCFLYLAFKIFKQI